MRVLPKGRSFTANSGTKAAILSKGRSSITNSGAKAAVLLGIEWLSSSRDTVTLTPSIVNAE